MFPVAILLVAASLGSIGSCLLEVDQCEEVSMLNLATGRVNRTGWANQAKDGKCTKVDEHGTTKIQHNILKFVGPGLPLPTLEMVTFRPLLYTITNLQPVLEKCVITIYDKDRPYKPTSILVRAGRHKSKQPAQDFMQNPDENINVGSWARHVEHSPGKLNFASVLW